MVTTVNGEPSKTDEQIRVPFCSGEWTLVGQKNHIVRWRLVYHQGK